MHILIWLYDIFLLGSIVWLSKIHNASMPSYFFLSKLHICFLEVRRKKALLWYALVRNQTPLSNLRVPFEEYMWTMFYFKRLQNLQVTKMWKWEEITLFRSRSNSQPLKEIWKTLHISHKYELYFWNNCYASLVSWTAVFMLTLS